MPTPGENRSQPLAERETHHPQERHSQGTENESNNIFITEKPGEMDGEDEEEHELAEDVKQEEPVPPGQMQSQPESQAEGQIVPYSEQEEMEIIYSEEEIASFKNIFDMFDKENTGYINLDDFQSIMGKFSPFWFFNKISFNSAFRLTQQEQRGSIRATR